VHVTAIRATLLQQAQAFLDTWLAYFPEHRRVDTERRTATLLPCLMLARIDGKSPVEYLSPAERQIVRDIAMPLVAAPVATVRAVIARVGAHLADEDTHD
jgi:hypothetical protein